MFQKMQTTIQIPGIALLLRSWRSDKDLITEHWVSCHELCCHFSTEQYCCDVLLNQLNQLIDTRTNKREATKRRSHLSFGFFIQDYFRLRRNRYEDKNISVHLYLPLLFYSDVVWYSTHFLLFFPTFLFLPSPSCWIVDISADWQYEGKKKKKRSPSFSLCLVCVPSLCQFINPADPPWDGCRRSHLSLLQRTGLTPHPCPVMPPSLTSFSATFHSSWTVESEFNKVQITTRFLLFSCSPLCCCCTPPLLCTSTSVLLCVIIHMIF